jgi:tetratricopeptide (TPR) repeat protein
MFAELAHHFRQADEPVKAIDYLEKAADQAMKHFTNREAVKFLEDVLALNEQTGSVATRTRRARWKADLGKAYRALGQTTQARSHLEGALEHLDHGVPRRGARLGLQMAWHIARALAPTRRSMAGYLTDIDPKAVTAVDAYNQLALLMHYINEYASQIFCVFAGLKDAPRAGPTPEVAQLYGTAANVFAFMGLHSTARRYAALTHAVAEATGQPLTVGIAHQYTGHLAACLGELSWFDRDMHRALAIYDECCHPRLWEEALTNCAYLYAFQGDLERSHAAYLRLERSGRSRDDLQTTAWGLLGQGRVLLARGQFEEALARLNQAEPLVRDNISRGELYGNRALVYLRAGSTEHAEAEALRARDLLRAAPSATYTNLGAYTTTTEVLLTLWEHRGDAARRELRRAGQQMCRLLRRFGRTIPLARPQSMLWSGVYAWRLGWSAVAQRRWRQTLMAARRIGLPADEAAAHYWLGAGHSGPTGRDHLARAATLYERLGYAFEAARARRVAG